MAPSELACFALRFERNSGFDSPRPVLRGVRTIASIVFKQALLEVTRYAGVVNCRVCMTHQNINNEIFISWPAKPYSLERAKKVKTAPPFSTLLPRGSPESFRGWARQDSNLGPRDYESPALTAELRALRWLINGAAVILR